MKTFSDAKSRKNWLQPSSFKLPAGDQPAIFSQHGVLSSILVCSLLMLMTSRLNFVNCFCFNYLTLPHLIFWNLHQLKICKYLVDHDEFLFRAAWGHGWNIYLTLYGRKLLAFFIVSEIYLACNNSSDYQAKSILMIFFWWFEKWLTFHQPSEVEQFITL